MRFCSRCGAELPTKANFCATCGTRVISETSSSIRHQVFKVPRNPKIVVTNTAPGSIIVKGGSKGEVDVDLDMKGVDDLECSATQEGNTVIVNCRAKMGVWGWSSYIFGTKPKVDVCMSIPSESDLDLECRAGRIEAEGVKGNITIESSAGAIHVQDCKGAVKARTRAGSVALRDVDGRVNCRSSAGSIDYTGVLADSENLFRTNVGSIDILLKGEPSLSIEASTALGSITCVPELQNVYREGSRLKGRIGTGNGRLIAETKTGSIRIKHQTNQV